MQHLFFLCAKLEDLQLLKSILDLEIFDLKMKNSNNENLLHMSCFNQNMEVFKHLQKRGLFDLLAKNRKDESVLHLIARNNSLGMLQYLIENLLQKNEKINEMRFKEILAKKCDRGDNILHLSAKSNNLEMLKYLINLNLFDLQEKNDDNQNVLHLSRHFEMIKFLIELKKIDLKKKNKMNQNILEISVKFIKDVSDKVSVRAQYFSPKQKIRTLSKYSPPCDKRKHNRNSEISGRHKEI